MTTYHFLPSVFVVDTDTLIVSLVLTLAVLIKNKTTLIQTHTLYGKQRRERIGEQYIVFYTTKI